MDLDRFLALNGPAWSRLEDLCGRAGPNARRLSGGELDELLQLYQRVSTHLSYASTNFSDPGLLNRLSRVVSRAGALIYGSKPKTLRALVDFFVDTLPAAIWCARRQLFVSAFFTFAPAVALGIWLSVSPAAVKASAPAALRQAYVSHDFASYYSSAPSSEFASHVFTNNVVVTWEVFGAGMVLCIPAVLILADNGANLGIAAGLFTNAGHTPEFWGLILPHGLIELTSVVIAGAAGIRIGWRIIDPGDRRRRDALAEEANRSVVLVMGTVFTLAIAGTIEGFVTGSGLPTWLRVGIGVSVEVLFVSYVVFFGRRAYRAGHTGRIGESRRAWVVEKSPRRVTAGRRP